MPPKRRKSNSPYARAVRRGVARGQPAVVETPEPQVQLPVMEDIPEQPQAISGDRIVDQGPAPARSVPSASGIDTGAMPSPLLSVGDTVGAHVSQATRDKIWGSEFIDLGILLETNQELLTTQTLTLVDGAFVLKSKGSKKKIETIEAWTDAFIIYMAIFTQRHDRGQELLKYMSVVRLAAKSFRGIGWKSYDEQFRLRQARQPERSWAVVDGELWLTCLTTSMSRSGDLLTQNKTFGAKGGCYDYNFKGFCQRTNCGYVHKCLQCGGGHPKISCFRGNQGHGNMTSQKMNSTNTGVKQGQSSNQSQGQGNFRASTASYNKYHYHRDMGSRKNTDQQNSAQ